MNRRSYFSIMLFAASMLLFIGIVIYLQDHTTTAVQSMRQEIIPFSGLSLPVQIFIGTLVVFFVVLSLIPLFQKETDTIQAARKPVLFETPVIPAETLPPADHLAVGLRA